MSKNVIIGQSGGPTAVLDFQPGQHIQSCLQSGDPIRSTGMKYGIEGLLKEEMLELKMFCWMTA